MKKKIIILLISIILFSSIYVYTCINQYIFNEQNVFVWKVIEEGKRVKSYDNLQSAVDNCNEDGVITLTKDFTAFNGAIVSKEVTIDCQNYTVDISNCPTSFITVENGAKVNLSNLTLDGKESSFEVDYGAITYQDYTIPLKQNSLNSDLIANQSAVISYGSIVFNKVNFINRYSASYGGAVQILSGNADFNYCNFTHNYGTARGGALLIGGVIGNANNYPVEKVNLNNCIFENNYTKNGGAIYASNATEINIENTVFNKNTANNGNGGAICLSSQTTYPNIAENRNLDFIKTTIKDCVFNENWAGNDGFAIASSDADLYLYSCEFTKNIGVHPTSSVGTISVENFRVDQSWRVYTLLDSCIFEENKGACSVYGDHSSVADLDVIDCLFKNNDGQMSFLLRSSVANIQRCQFDKERAQVAVIDTSLHEDLLVMPLLKLTDVTFTNCVTNVEILNRKQVGETEKFNTYHIVLDGNTNGNIAVCNNNKVTVLGNHSGNITLDTNTERSNLEIQENATLNGVVVNQLKKSFGETVTITVNAKGSNLTYTWLYYDVGSTDVQSLNNTTSTYTFTMTENIVGRQICCIVKDDNNNNIITELIILSN